MEFKSKEREKILDKIKKAGSEEYVTDWDSRGAIVRQKKKTEIKKGKKSKAKGGAFEVRVRKDLEEKGWVVDKWSNNVDLEEGRITPAKRKFNPFNKVMTIGTGFPDFVAMQNLDLGKHRVIGVEVKVNGTLSRVEKLKCKWLLDNKIFSDILIAKKVKEKNRVKVEYVEVNDLLEKMR